MKPSKKRSVHSSELRGEALRGPFYSMLLQEPFRRVPGRLPCHSAKRLADKGKFNQWIWQFVAVARPCMCV